MTKNFIFSISVLSILLVGVCTAEARGSHGGRGAHSYSRASTGTGAKLSSTPVQGYIKQNGTYVLPSYRSTPDNNKDNNWSTRPNVNPYTGQIGTK